MLNEVNTKVDVAQSVAVTTKTAGPTITAFLKEALSLRTLAVEAVADFFGRIHTAEMDQKLLAELQPSGYPSFESMLRRNNVCDLENYANFKIAVQVFGLDRVRNLGVPQTAILLGIPDSEPSRAQPEKTAREAAIEDVEASKERNGVPASPRQVQAFAIKHFQRVETSKPKPTVNEQITALTDENDTLKREISVLKRKLAATEAKLSRAEERRVKTGQRSKR